MEQQIWDGFNPELYVKYNYENPNSVDIMTVSRMVEIYKSMESNYNSVAEIGAGPNLLPIFASLPFVKSITAIEYSQSNIEYLEKCKESIPQCWDKWIYFLKVMYPTCFDVDFQYLIKKKLNIVKGSVYELPKNSFNIVSMHYVAESITCATIKFYESMNRIKESLKPNGQLIASFMAGFDYYEVGGIQFPAVNKSLEEFDSILKHLFNDFQDYESIKIPSPNNGIYDSEGVLFINTKR